MERISNKVRKVKPVLIKTTTHTLPSGKQMTVMRRDYTLTGISWRIPV